MARMHSNRSVMQHSFSQVPKAEIPRSTFDRSHGHKTTFDAGLLIPIYLDEALPGDTFKVNMTAFARLATPIFPIMDNMFLDSQFFAVPIRLIWDNWEKFNGAQDNPADSTDFLVPQITAGAGGFTAGSIYDYMGVPLGAANLSISALWNRAYSLIWNTWYRDQNLQNSLTVPKGDGPDAPTLYNIQRRGKRHDYFTSALPWPQKGPGVTIPLGTEAPVRGIGGYSSAPGSNASGIRETGGITKAYTAYWQGNTSSTPPQGIYIEAKPSGAGAGYPNIYADLTQASSATINSLRQAFQIQKILERDARGGTRYVELLKSHFGVTSPDFRLQRPEFLGGGSTPVNISPIPQTSATDATSPQANLAAIGTALASNHGFTMSFTEHCIIIGLVSVRADLTYQQGLNRMFSRRTRFDFYWPALSHIGEQAILRKEIYATGVAANDDVVFGYQERYGEYRYKPSIITGLFRSSHPQTLDSWHLSQNFATPPVLDDAFIQENPPVDRVIAVPAEPHFLLDTYFAMHTARPMPVFGVPGLMDHF